MHADTDMVMPCGTGCILDLPNGGMGWGKDPIDLTKKTNWHFVLRVANPRHGPVNIAVGMSDGCCTNGGPPPNEHTLAYVEPQINKPGKKPRNMAGAMFEMELNPMQKVLIVRVQTGLERTSFAHKILIDMTSNMYPCVKVDHGIVYFD